MIRYPAVALVFALTTQTLLSARAIAADQQTPEAIAQAVDMAILREVFSYDESKQAPLCDDETYLRRVWLDVVGDIPTPEHVIAFALDPSPDKRAAVVKELLADTQYGVNWARYWRDVIMYRRIEDRALIAANALDADLSEQLNINAPWDLIASSFISASGDVRDNGATAIFMAQDGQTEESAAEVSRIFLGIQIQCAQCHDHPYDRWKREQFHELAAFFPRIAVRNVQTASKRSYEVYASDRTMVRRRGNNDNLPQPEHLMPNLEDPELPGTRMQPKFFLTGAKLPPSSYDARRRETLAEWLTSNEWFAMALVNRMWSELVGEGFYEPVDDIGPDRDATAPAAAKVLADAFSASGYDLKWLIETICATEAYQRVSRPRRAPGEPAFAANVAQPLRGDQLFNAVLSALGLPEQRTRAAGRQFRGQNNASTRTGFIAEFGFDPSQQRESISRSIPQTLVMMNSPQISAALSDRRSMVAQLATSEITDEQLVVELCLRCLSRQPRASELSIAVGYLDEQADRTTAASDLAWALINSAEFQHRR